jgi:mRNA interferase MazF
VVAVRGSRSAVGHEQKGTRPAVIVQADTTSWLGTVIVAPTSTGAQPAEFRPEVTVRGRATRVLVDQVQSVDRSRLGRSSGHLAAADLRQVDEALKIVFGLF